MDTKVVSEPASSDWWEGVMYACEYLADIGLGATDTDIYNEAIDALKDCAEYKECPNHEGNYDCNSFCRICEGYQEYKTKGNI